MRVGAKFVYLESLRGLAALAVVFCHLDLAFFDPSVRTMIPFAGSFSVRLFFLLSGFVLSISYFRNGRSLTLVSAALRRYPRLMLPACASVLLAWSFMEFGWMRNHEAAVLMKHPSDSWLSLNFSVHLSFLQALEQGTFGTFFHFNNAVSLNGVLWTMPVELVGSFFVFGFLATLRFFRLRWLPYAIVAILFAVVIRRTMGMYMLDFLTGIALCDYFIAQRKIESTDLRAGATASIAILMCIVSSLVGIWATTWCMIHPRITFFGVTELATLSSAAIVGVSALSGPMQSMLGHPVISLLGRISFPLYLIHTVLINSVGCAIYLQLRAWGILHLTAACITAGVTTLVCVLTAWGAYYIFELPAIRLSAEFSKLCLLPFASRSR